MDSEYDDEAAFVRSLRAIGDADYDDSFESEGQVENTYSRRFHVQHAYGRVWMQLIDTDTGRKISMRLNHEEAKQAALLLTEHPGANS